MSKTESDERPSRIVLASSNIGKLAEFGALLAEWKCEVLSQDSFSVSAAAETGDSFVENALLKAHWAAAQTGLPALADDSGLEVDALGGAPGIYSARYAGVDASDEDNNRKLLASLTGLAPAQRSARFHCALVYLRHWQDPNPVICQASWEGQILTAPEGDQGFGYDPLFYVPDQGCSAASLPAGVKNQISHRAQALLKLQAELQREYT